MKDVFAQRTQWNLAKNRFSASLERLRRDGAPLLDLTVSNPTDCGFTYAQTDILRALNHPESLQYAPEAQGLGCAREAIARYYETAATPVAVEPSDIFLTTSTSEAYSYAFRLLCDPGDQVLVPRPGYPLFDFLATIQDVAPITYPLIYDHGWHVDVHALEAAVTERTRAVVVVHPNNPTGSFVREAERLELARICADRGLTLLSDEVFLDYGLGRSGRTFAQEAACLTLTLSGLSKIAGLPQMKLAWMVVSGPAAVKAAAKARLEVIADTYLSLNTPIQVAAGQLLDSRKGFQAQLRARLEKNLAELDSQLASAPQCRRLEAEAGWYATLRVPVTRSDEDLAVALMEEQGVIVHPGHFFDFAADGFLVVSLMTREEDFREGMRRVLSATA